MEAGIDESLSDQDAADIVIRLPSGEVLEGRCPVVVIGPNGSGKTRQARHLSADQPIAFINALRNTRVAPELPATGVDTARANFNQQRAQAHGQHWELSSEFDYMLTQLFAEAASADVAFARRFRRDPTTAGEPEDTALHRLETVWGTVFPGRELLLKDWKPVVSSSTGGGDLVEYSGHLMSDGEKAALFLAGRVLSSDAGVLVVDEPETHLHSLLAARLWDALENARPDVRFVYITHDLTFALSRSSPEYLLCSPTSGLQRLEISTELPDRVAGTLLGAASLSFYASRIVFCEGDPSSLDFYLYSAWFNGRDTVVRPVESCDDVIRCVTALRASRLASSLECCGIIDRDYRAQRFIDALPDGLWPLPFHEVESVLASPGVVAAVAEHVGATFDSDAYLDGLRRSVSDEQRHQIVVRRWRVSVEPLMQGIASGIGSRNQSMDDLIADLPGLLEASSWGFDPVGLLTDEKIRVETALASGSAEEVLALVPGKQLIVLGARACGLEQDRYEGLICDALQSPDESPLSALGSALQVSLTPHLPVRTATEPTPADALPPAV
jgi:hypothetical protein